MSRSPAPAAKRKFNQDFSLRTLRKDARRNWELYLFSIPGLVLLVTFYYIPMYNGIMMSFVDYIPKLGVNGSDFVGLKHFRQLISAHSFWTNFSNTIKISVYSLAASFPLPILFALMLNDLPFLRYKKIVQSVSYAPNFLSVVVVVGVMNMFLSAQGPFSTFANALGLTFRNIVGQQSSFRHMYVWSGIWQSMGYSSILYVAALANVDLQLVDAAKIDGASKLQIIWHIDLPHIAPTAVIMLIFAIGGIMNVGFEKVLLMQTPLNLKTSEVLSTYVYKIGILYTKYSFASAVGLFNSVINFALLFLANQLTKRISSTSLW